MKTIQIVCLCLLFPFRLLSGSVYIHSHNDYRQDLPLLKALEAKSSSVEADVFFRDGEFFVAHEESEIVADRTLKSLYLEPLKSIIVKNGGRVYSDGSDLLLMIDLKQSYKDVLRHLEKEILSYEGSLDGVKIVLTGRIPLPSDYDKFNDIFYFDITPETVFTDSQCDRVAMLSMPFYQISKWDGVSAISDTDYRAIKEIVGFVHGLGKPVRFWGCPDNPKAWALLIDIGVDYINTDTPGLLREYIDKLQK